MYLTPNTGASHLPLHFRRKILPVAWTRKGLFYTLNSSVSLKPRLIEKFCIISEFSIKRTTNVILLSPWDKHNLILLTSVNFQRAKLSTRSIAHLWWCNWKKHWRRNATGSSPSGSYSSTTMPRLTGHFQLRRKWPTWNSSFFITHPILRIWARRTTSCPHDRNNNWKLYIFLPKRISLLLRRTGRKKKDLNYSWVVCKS